MQENSGDRDAASRDHLKNDADRTIPGVRIETPPGVHPAAGQNMPEPVSPRPAAPRTTPSLPPSDISFFDETLAVRFPTGTMLTDRYRIVTKLGRGGMGEVYRAEDLLLGQDVALKFLSQEVLRQKSRLDAILNEVRTARRISHPNVCRIHDVFERQGEYVISMEYIDGENLGQLLRRVGRFNDEKGVEMARQLCAGLAAVHDAGLVHRDLKPANVMVDGRGVVRLTDFGLTTPVLPAQSGRDLVASGTPLYMAPEQWTGGAVSNRTDLYALGLVLYEVFVGERAFTAGTVEELKRQHLEVQPRSPSTRLPGFDPSIERAIERCLEKDPTARPASAHSVAALLPGGDPLAAAMAERVTPSPEVVAAAGTGFRMPIRSTVLLYLATLSLFAGILFLADRTFLVSQTNFARSPEALAERARIVVESAGFSPEVKDIAYGFAVDDDRRSDLQEKAIPAAAWNTAVREMPGMVRFWYRQSGERLVPNRPFPDVTPDDPPANAPGAFAVELTTTGELLRFETGPSVVSKSTPVADADRDATLKKLLDLSGVDPRSLESTTPTWNPPVFADQRHAWKGKLSSSTSPIDVRIEAATLLGRPVFFRTIFPWTEERHTIPTPQLSLGFGTTGNLAVFVILFAHVATIYLAWKNRCARRADLTAALRVGAAMALLAFLLNVMRYLPRLWLLGTFNASIHLIGRCLYAFAMGGIFYMAIEPFARKTWPHAMIAWTRLVRGSMTCGVVSRDTLIGLAAGAACVFVTQLDWLIAAKFNLPPGVPIPPLWLELHALSSTADAAAALPMSVLFATYNSIILFSVVMVVRMLLPNKLTATIACILIMTAIFGKGAGPAAITFTSTAILCSIIVPLVMRYGLLVLTSLWLSYMIFFGCAITIDPSSWFFPKTVAAIAVPFGVATFAAVALIRGSRAPAHPTCALYGAK